MSSVTKPPSMMASYQTHEFATAQLSSMYKFSSDRLRELMIRCYGESDKSVIDANIKSILGEKPIRIKKMRDPDRPKKNLTGYQLFCKDFRSKNKKIVFTPGPGSLLEENIIGLAPYFGRGDLDYFAYLEYLESLSGIKHTKENKQSE